MARSSSHPLGSHLNAGKLFGFRAFGCPPDQQPIGKRISTSARAFHAWISMKIPSKHGPYHDRSSRGRFELGEDSRSSTPGEPPLLYSTFCPHLHAIQDVICRAARLFCGPLLRVQIAPGPSPPYLYRRRGVCLSVARIGVQPLG